MPDWSTLLSGGFGALIIHGLIIIAKGFFNKKVVDADAAARLSNSAVLLIEQAQENARIEIGKAREEATQARYEATEARREAAEARLEAAACRRAMDDAMHLVGRITDMLMQPNVSLELLRDLISNGQARGYPVRRKPLNKEVDGA